MNLEELAERMGREVTLGQANHMRMLLVDWGWEDEDIGAVPGGVWMEALECVERGDEG
jgi:hypothetical protein